MKVLSVASECAPFVKTGGLADVVGALPGALARLGVEVRVLVPGYPAVKAALPEDAEARALGRLPGGRARVISARAAGVDLMVLDSPRLFDRPGNPYLGPDGRGLARQPPALRCLVPRRGANRHRRDRWLAAGCGAPARLAGGPDRGVPRARPPAGAARPAHHPQHRLPGPLPAGGGDAAGAAQGRVPPRWLRVLRPGRLPQGRPRLRGPHLDGQPDLRPRADAPGVRDGAWKGSSLRAAPRCAASSTASTSRSGIRRATRTSPRTSPRGRRPARPGTARPWSGGSASMPAPRARCSAWSAVSPGRRAWTCCWRSCHD